MSHVMDELLTEADKIMYSTLQSNILTINSIFESRENRLSDFYFQRYLIILVKIK